MSNVEAPAHQKLHLLLAARGNPDHGQDPDQPPFGVPRDALVDVPIGPGNPLNPARRLVEAFCDEHGLGGGNWVGGDLWADGVHMGHLSYNGRFHQREPGPLVRNGVFVFGNALAGTPRPTAPTDMAEGWLDVLLSSVEASTDDDWYQVLSIRPDLAERLRAVLERAAPASSQTAETAPSTSDLTALIAESLPDDDTYTGGFRDAAESLVLALRDHVAPGILRESLQTALDAYGNHAPAPENGSLAASL